MFLASETARPWCRKPVRWLEAPNAAPIAKPSQTMVEAETGVVHGAAGLRRTRLVGRQVGHAGDFETSDAAGGKLRSGRRLAVVVGLMVAGDR